MKLFAKFLTDFTSNLCTALLQTFKVIQYFTSSYIIDQFNSFLNVFSCYTGGKLRNHHEIVLTQFCSQATSGTRRGSFKAEN